MQISITPRGRSLFRKILPVAREPQLRLINALSHEERQVFFTAARRLLGQVGAPLGDILRPGARAPQRSSSMSVPAEFVFEAQVKVDSALIIGQSSRGLRRVVPILGGSFTGPRLAGSVLPGGADWQFVRPDGVLSLEARYTLQVDDGTLIAVTNRGMRHGPAEIIAKIGRGEDVPADSYYFRTVAEFEAPIGKHDWLNKGVFLGLAERRAGVAVVRYHLLR